MTAEWQQVQLREIAENITVGYVGPMASEYVEQGIPFLRSQNVQPFRLTLEDVKYITPAFHSKIKKSALVPGDVVTVRTGKPGTTTVVPENLAVANCSDLVIIRPSRNVDSRWLSYFINSAAASFVSSRLVGAVQQHFNVGSAKEMQVFLPPLEEQQAISSTLGVLDDKIESNRRQQELLRSLGSAKFSRATLIGGRDTGLEKVTLSIARGVSPKYADDDMTAPFVINQRCIRDGWVSLNSARRMQNRVVKPTKRASGGDILVNSTGTGTLGRLARWHEGDIFVDSHVTVVKPDPKVVPPTVLAYSLLERQVDIERLATGSTGQTELSPKRLGGLAIRLPDAQTAISLEDELLTIENMAMQLMKEMSRLEALRNVLLPELLSGRIHVSVEGDMS